MILQRLVFHSYSEEMETLYYKCNKYVNISENSIHMQTEGILNLETYYNLFSCEKWKKYAGVHTICLNLQLQGKIHVEIIHLETKKELLKRRCVYEEDFTAKEISMISTDGIEIPDSGMLGIIISALEESVVYSGYIGTEQMLIQNQISIGIGICTFKREPYVERNIKLLTEGILNNEDSAACGHISICISDNAGTLNPEKFAHPGIRIVKNKNLGGVGGFTRTMLEHLHGQENITHVLLMDDDVIVTPETIERTYLFLSVLKQEYRDYVLGGALMRMDFPVLQYESGAKWNNGDMIAHNHDFDMSQTVNCVMNENETEQDYVGWWYSCIPVSFIQKNKLPLPLFIHRDDIEYGMRANGEFLFLNGICVWHEAFENKCPGVNEYYDIRNLAILNAIHDEGYTAKDFKKTLFKQISSNIGKYRYRYVDLNLLGALDFLRGASWFSKQDAVETHKKLAAYNYELKKKDEYVGYKGLTADDLKPYGKKQQAEIGLPEKIWKMGTMNGHFFPSKKGEPKVEIPYPNIYELYRCGEVLYVDSTDNVLYTRKSVKDMVLSYMKFFKVCRYIDRDYEKVCRQYRDAFPNLISEEYWMKYLNLEEDK